MVKLDMDMPKVCVECPLLNREWNKCEVLDKIRAEIENDWQLNKYPSSPFSCGLRRALEILDKYKGDKE